MTITGVFMRLPVLTIDSFHCWPFRPSTRPESTAATNTPVPAAESQLMAKRAPSGLALASTTGGTRCTMLCRAGMSQTGSDSVPLKAEPSSSVLKAMPENRPFR